ncbi:MAG: hypothetical protein R3B13_12020 [Polyangiaceae bacterium]
MSAQAAETAIAGEDPAEAEQRRAISHGMDDKRGPRFGERKLGPLGVDASGGAAVGSGVRGSFGRVFTQGLDPGWYGRLELSAFTAASLHASGPVGGALIGGEFWTAPDAAGGGLPMSFYFGLRSPAVISTLGGGFELFIVDDVKDDTGFGLYAPFGAFALGIEAGGVRILAEGRAQFRWQWGADDRTQLSVGLSIAHVFENEVPTIVENDSPRVPQQR